MLRTARPLLALAAALALAPPAAAQTGGFVVRLGDDTLSVERVERTANRVTGEYVTRTPRSQHRTYTLDLDHGRVKRFEMVTRNLGPGPGRAESRSLLELPGDGTATSTVPRGDSSARTLVKAGRNAVPFVLGAIGLMEQIAVQARAAGGPVYEFDLVAFGATEASRGTVRWVGRDTLHLNVSGPLGSFGPWILRADAKGTLLHYSGPGTPFQGEATRTESADVSAARDAYASRPLGQLSARDTARAELGGAEVWVDYGRPARRGRTVFGNVVPWSVVWRTGANAATQFRTPVDLLVGGAEVPAGTYSLWTLPSPDGWKLILNRQTGQWGTMYDPQQDLVRVEMTVEALESPMDRMTIAIDPREGGAVLRVAWDHTQASVPISRKP
jgi:hypothetical protein